MKLLLGSRHASMAGTSVASRRIQLGVRARACPRPVVAGWGFTEDFEAGDNSDLVVPKSMYGLSFSQMSALGLHDSVIKRPEPRPELLTAKAHYVGDAVPTSGATRTPTKAMAAGYPGSAPPDLPSLLLDGRIVYIGMPIVPSVAELVISELLWLNYNNQEKPIYLYLNSTGTQRPDGQSVAFETDALAILDTMNYIRPEIHTLVVGQAFGNAALLLASGKKGKRFALPHSRIMTCPPRMNRSFGKAVDQMIKANELDLNTQTYAELLAKHTGRDVESVRKDVGRNRYFTPTEAIEYGIIDRVIAPNQDVLVERQDYEAALRAQSGGGSRRGQMAGAEAGM